MRNRITTNGPDINVLIFAKERERYVWIYRDSDVTEALRTLGQFASNAKLSFTWWDAARCAQKIRGVPVTKNGGTES